MSSIQQLLTDHIGIWASAETEKKSGRGRASGNAASVYGIKKLRELILELAVRGKLVSQDANDEPASELFNRLCAEKAQLIAKGEIKFGKPQSVISSGEKPFPLPVAWKWIRLGDFALSIISGGTPSKNNSEFWNGDIPWASVKDLNGEKFIGSTEDYITKSGLEAGSKLANIGDLLICTRMGLGKIAIAAVDVAINQDLKALKLSPLIDIDYFINFYSTLKIVGSGMTVAGIKQDELLGYCIPTPPLAEQHRIVAKVDELMALCDQLESQHSNAADAHGRLVCHLLNTLTQSESATDFDSSWQRIAGHFDTLFTTESSIDSLKQTLLQLAVMGKLVESDANDEPAIELLRKIQVEKARLVSEGALKKNKPLPAICDEEKPFELPSCWEWARFPELGEFGRGKSKHRPRNDPKLFDPPIHALVQTGEVARAKSVITEYHSKYSELGLAQSKKWPVGTLCITIAANIADSALLGFEACFPDSVVGFVPCKPIEDARYFLAFMKTARQNLLKFAPATAQKNINLEILESVLIPIPPRAEMDRIVAKIEELMRMCDQIKGELGNMGRVRQKIADAIVEYAVVA